MGRRERIAGQRYERELCALLEEHLGEGINRELGQEREGGSDILLPGDERGFSIQVKYRRVPRAIGPWWEQAWAESLDYTPSRIPVLAVRFSRRPWAFFMAARDLFSSFEHWPAKSVDHLLEMRIAVFAAIVRETWTKDS